MEFVQFNFALIDANDWIVSCPLHMMPNDHQFCAHTHKRKLNVFYVNMKQQGIENGTGDAMQNDQVEWLKIVDDHNKEKQCATT